MFLSFLTGREAKSGPSGTGGVPLSKPTVGKCGKAQISGLRKYRLLLAGRGNAYTSGRKVRRARHRRERSGRKRIGAPGSPLRTKRLNWPSAWRRVKGEAGYRGGAVEITRTDQEGGEGTADSTRTEREGEERESRAEAEDTDGEMGTTEAGIESAAAWK